MVKLLIHRAGKGRCALTGREAEGFQLSFEDGSFTQTFLSYKSFRQLVSMRLAQGDKESKPFPEAVAIESTVLVRLTIHSVGKGKCALTGREAEGFLFSFADGSFTQTFLSHKSFRQLVNMRMAQGGAESKPIPVGLVNNSAAEMVSRS